MMRRKPGDGAADPIRNIERSPGNGVVPDRCDHAQRIPDRVQILVNEIAVVFDHVSIRAGVGVEDPSIHSVAVCGVRMSFGQCSPTYDMMSVMYLTPYFWDFVDKSGKCWLWTGKLAGRGYGQASAKINGHWTMVYAHRASYEMAHGPIPKGLYVLHSCDVPNCVRPDHLSLGTQKDNMQQMKDRGRSGRFFTPETVRMVRADPRTCTVIAAEYGCTDSAVYNIKQGLTWAWVK